jgi:hypothetical protein
MKMPSLARKMKDTARQGGGRSNS